MQQYLGAALHHATGSTNLLYRANETDIQCWTTTNPAAVCSILVANNGLAAVKFISYLRRWANSSFGHDRVVSMMVQCQSVHRLLSALEALPRTFPSQHWGCSACMANRAAGCVRIEACCVVDQAWGHASLWTSHLKITAEFACHRPEVPDQAADAHCSPCMLGSRATFSAGASQSWLSQPS